MKKYHEVIERTLELFQTLEEGIYDMREHLIDFHYEDAITLIKDIAEGVESIENALEPILPDLIKNDIESLTTTLKEYISKTISRHEHKNERNLEKQMQEELILLFKNWRQEIERVLIPYSVS